MRLIKAKTIIALFSSRKPIAALRITSGLFGFAALLLSASFGVEAASQETICSTSVNGKVAWNKEGNTNWSYENIVLLCDGAKNSLARISCFQGEIYKNVAWDTAIKNCKTKEAVGELDARLKAGWDPNNPFQQKYVQIEGLVVHKRTEISDDEVYIEIFADGERNRIPEVEVRPNTPDEYFWMLMNEEDPDLDHWRICKTYAPKTVFGANVMEKDGQYQHADSRKFSDLIGNLPPLPMAAWTPGRYVKEMKGDGGHYSLVYNVAVNKANFLACTADERRAFKEKRRESACEKRCSSAHGDGIKNCGINPDEGCGALATVLLGCIGICEAVGGF